MRSLRIVLIAALALILLLSTTSGAFLVENNPQHADVIIVLAGETDRRPSRGLELLSQNYAPKMLLDVPAVAKIYDLSLADIAREYVQHLPQKNSVMICPIVGLSTKAEAHDVATCLKPLNAHRLLVVTSDYHTRRALSTLQHELPEYEIHIASVSDLQQFGVRWWKHRQWAKMNFEEWLRLVWWEVIDRWR